MINRIVKKARLADACYLDGQKTAGSEYIEDLLEIARDYQDSAKDSLTAESVPKEEEQQR